MTPITHMMLDGPGGKWQQGPAPALASGSKAALQSSPLGDLHIAFLDGQYWWQLKNAARPGVFLHFHYTQYKQNHQGIFAPNTNMCLRPPAPPWRWNRHCRVSTSGA